MMTSHSEEKDQFKRFISDLYSGLFDGQDQRVFENLDKHLIYNEPDQDYFKRVLIGFSNDGRGGLSKLDYTVNYVITNDVPATAIVVTKALIKIYETKTDDQILRWLIDLTLTFKLYDLVNLENGGLKIRFRSSSILLNTYQIRSDLKMQLLKLLLGKYHSLIVDESIPRNRYVRDNVRRLHNVFNEIYKFGRDELKADRKLRPFSYDRESRVEYTKDRSIHIFGSDVQVENYDDLFEQEFLIPLMPLLEDSTLELGTNRLSFINEGVGVFPPIDLYVSIDDEEFFAGRSEKTWSSSETCYTYLENDVIDFFKSKPKSKTVVVLIRFVKFGVGYEYQVVSDDVGSWIRSISPKDQYMKISNILSSISATQFENLIFHLVTDKLSEENSSQKEYKDVNIPAEFGGGDRSRDVVATEVSTSKRFIFQCKHEHVTPGKLENEMNTFKNNMDNGEIEKFDCYKLVTSGSVSPELEDKGNALAREMGMEFGYWSCANIENLFENSPTAKSKFKEF